MKSFSMIERCDDGTLPELNRRIVDQHEVFLHHPGSIFGLGANALSREAVDKIRTRKGNTESKGFIVLIPSASALSLLGVPADSARDRLLSQYWPGNLTVVLPCADPRLAHLAVDGQVAFRVPPAVNFRRFLEMIGLPIVSTSVNHTGEPPTNDLRVIRREFADWIDFALLFRSEYVETPAPSTVIGFHDGSPICLREGSIPFAEIRESWEHPLLLVICTANICRSPIGEYRLRAWIERLGLPHRVRSAGFLQGGIPISENSRIVLEEAGFEAAAHRSTQIRGELLRSAQWILTMTNRHRDDILEWYPNAEHKVLTMNQFAELNGDIVDPFGMDLNTYRRTDAMIEDACARVAERLNREYT
jgi:tRNA threonylcarbamoyl adenosine modification protein (Sua5/YciO/YrdC/YwlC family)